MNSQEYFEHIGGEVAKQFVIAGQARAKGVDPVNSVEIPIATSLAEKSIGLISTIYPQLNDRKIINRIVELEKEYGPLTISVSFKIAEEIAKEKYCKFESLLQAIDAGIRVGFAYTTLGVVSSPLEGFTELKLGRTLDGKEYFKAYFSGPIRSAGTTASCVVLMLIDYLRELFGYAKYDPTEEEIKRYVTENYDYHERINNLQYLPTEEEITFLAKNIPIEITGEASEEREVSNYKDLSRIETNFIRGGMCLIFSEGLAQKAQKSLRLLRGAQEKGFKASGWEFLDEYIKIHKKREKGSVDASPTYIKDIVAGRPVFSHPSRSGGFRFRYGRTRTTGFSAAAVHPATMGISDCFLAVGTQLKIEKPTKGCALGVCDEIDGPIVKLRNGSVRKVQDYEEAKKIYPDVEEIIYLGDILFSFGDVANRNYELLKPGYCLPCDEKVFIFKDGLWQNISLSELIRGLDKTKFREYGDMTWYDSNQEVKVLSLNSRDYSVEETNVKKFLVRRCKENYLKIKLEDGRVIRVSKNHPLMSMTKEGMIKKKAREVEVGEYLPCAKSLNVCNKITELNLLDFFDKSGFRYTLKEREGVRSFRLKNSRVYLPCKINVDLNLARILGYYAAEGSSTINGKAPRVVFSFGKHEISLVKELSDAIEKVFNLKPVIVLEKTSLKVYLYGRAFCVLFEKMIGAGNNSYNKRVPSIIYNSPQETISNYLDTYFLGDGSIGKNQADGLCLEVACQSVSKNLIEDLHYLLLLIGINTTLCSYKHINILRIQGGNNIIDFIRKAGSSVRLRELNHLASAIYKPLSEKYPSFFFDLNGATNGRERHIIREAIARSGKIGGSTLLTCQTAELIKIKQGFIHPTKIISIQEEEYDGEFYNLELEKNHIFLHGNGVFSHNCEEWWELELKKAASVIGESVEVDKRNISIEKAIELSKKYNIPLHPSYIFYWKEINYEYFLGLLDWLAHGNLIGGKIILPYSIQDKERFAKGKRALELIGCEHSVSIENVVLSETFSRALLLNLGLDNDILNLEKEIEYIGKIISEKLVLEVVSFLSKFKIKDKSGTFIGARMGRPEKAKLRKLKGSPHVLFPVGEEGGRLRSFQEALNVGSVIADFPVYHCGKCKTDSVYPVCEKCGESCQRMSYCPECDCEYKGKCEEHPTVFGFKEKRIDIRHYLEAAEKKAGVRLSEIGSVVKGIRGTSSKDHSCENLAKGLLRAKYSLNVNKDGTIRYDMTEMPITHFKPKEVGTSVDLLRKIGYEKDINGKDLESEEQILTLFPHDVILPSCPESQDERADDVFVRVSKFIDDELEKLYGLPRMNNVKDRKDLIGSLVVCIAPHICTATVGRIIGFSKNQTFLASPYMHAAMRRDCDGDESAVMLLMDLLLNFSRKFLPSHRGGTQDAPLVLNTCIKAGEVDDQILDFELCGQYHLELYEFAEVGKHSSEIKLDNVKKRLKDGRDVFSNILFSHGCGDINKTSLISSYKTLPTMKEKVASQMRLCGKIRALDIKDVSRLIIERHFIRDIKGNLRKFSMQEFRCVNCNDKYRRPPLTGKCTNCGGKIIFTISEGSILKYLQPALDLARNYNASPYLLENLELTERYIQSIFGKEKEKQEMIAKWF